MKVLVNALSLGSISGQHVLFGHLKQLALWTRTEHEYIVLHQPRDKDHVQHLMEFRNIRLHEAPPSSHHWVTRSLWESAELPRLMKRTGVNLYFTPSGTILPASPVPQVSLAQNPWCFVPELQQTRTDKMKALLQRRAYRKAAQNARLMVYNSDHIRQLYVRNAAGRKLSHSVIVHQGINDETHAAGIALAAITPRQPFHVVSVSAMARWKGAETVVKAIGLLRAAGIPATLSLVGPWPDTTYELEIRALIENLKLQSAVQVLGKVTVDELHHQYASAMVYCLMSRCESFGIPAVEAQAFGTPVVGTSTTAMEEIGGDGGLFIEPDEPEKTAQSLRTLLTNPQHWAELSQAAFQNAQRYRWENCSRPLMKMFENHAC